MVQVPSLTVDARASRLAIAIAMGMSLMLVGCAVDQARHLNVAHQHSFRRLRLQWQPA